MWPLMKYQLFGYSALPYRTSSHHLINIFTNHFIIIWIYRHYSVLVSVFLPPLWTNKSDLSLFGNWWHNMSWILFIGTNAKGFSWKDKNLFKTCEKWSLKWSYVRQITYQTNELKELFKIVSKLAKNEVWSGPTWGK